MPSSPTELLAPAGTWDALEAAVAAGADAVYLGGKNFNMRMHRSDANFDDDALTRAVEFGRKHGVRIYITVNNLLSEAEIPAMRAYLGLLERIAPDALIVQDIGMLVLAKELGVTVPLHASVMMNTHSELAVRTLQEHGVSRVVFNREMTLAQLSLIKERTGIELEYFVHGDMCIAHSGQCLHSGVVFGQSSNRGRCLKPCRWPYRFAAAGAPLAAAHDPGPYKLAVKDMCLYLHLPQLIQAGVNSFKIEGRMRTPYFIGRIVGCYRRAIDRYLADPAGYAPDLAEWQELHAARSRDFSTCYAFGNPGAASIGYGGEREPRFFSQAVKEAGLTVAPSVPAPTSSSPAAVRPRPGLAVRVGDFAALEAAFQSGADLAYVGGEAFKPAAPWTVDEITAAVRLAQDRGASLVVATPRVTMDNECGELATLFAALEEIRPHGILVSNPGTLKLVRETTTLPVYADYSFNLFNSLTAGWLKSRGVVQATVSLEAAAGQVAALAAASPLALELIVHGPLEAMIIDHCLIRAHLAGDTPPGLCREICQAGDFDLLDSAGETHAVKIDQYCRGHILFARDLCLLGHLDPLAAGISRLRIEGHHYSPDHLRQVVAAYRQEIDRLGKLPAPLPHPDPADLLTGAPRPLGIGVFRHRISR